MVRELTILSDPSISGGEPREASSGVRVVDILDRINAGDSIEFVADDFGADRVAVALLVDLAGSLTTR